MHSGLSHDACYKVFDLKGLRSLFTAIIAAIIVVAIGGGKCQATRTIM